MFRNRRRHSRSHQQGENGDPNRRRAHRRSTASGRQSLFAADHDSPNLGASSRDANTSNGQRRGSRSRGHGENEPALPFSDVLGPVPKDRWYALRRLSMPGTGRRWMSSRSSGSGSGSDDRGDGRRRKRRGRNDREDQDRRRRHQNRRIEELVAAEIASLFRDDDDGDDDDDDNDDGRNITRLYGSGLSSGLEFRYDAHGGRSGDPSDPAHSTTQRRRHSRRSSFVTTLRRASNSFFSTESPSNSSQANPLSLSSGRRHSTPSSTEAAASADAVTLRRPHQHVASGILRNRNTANDGGRGNADSSDENQNAGSNNNNSNNSNDASNRNIGDPSRGNGVRNRQNGNGTGRRRQRSKRRRSFFTSWFDPFESIFNHYGLFGDGPKYYDHEYITHDAQGNIVPIHNSRSSPEGAVIYNKRRYLTDLGFASVAMILSVTFIVLIILGVFVSVLTFVMGYGMIVILALGAFEFCKDVPHNSRRAMDATHHSPLLCCSATGAILGASHAVCTHGGTASDFQVTWGLLEGAAYGLNIGCLWLFVFGNSSRPTLVTATAVRLRDRFRSCVSLWRDQLVNLSHSLRHRFMIINQQQLEMPVSNLTAKDETNDEASAKPRSTYEDNDLERHGCMICLERYKEGEAKQMLPCMHGFHPACIQQWISISSTCPICRISLEEHERTVPPTDGTSMAAPRELRARRTLAPRAQTRRRAQSPQRQLYVPSHTPSFSYGFLSSRRR